MKTCLGLYVMVQVKNQIKQGFNTLEDRAQQSTWDKIHVMPFTEINDGLAAPNHQNVVDDINIYMRNEMEGNEIFQRWFWGLDGRR